MSTIQDAYFNIRPNLYLNATTSTSTGILYVSEGQAFKINSDIFFSPNCKHTPMLPSSDFNPKSFHDSFKDSIQEFHKPLLWHPITAYLAFVPLKLAICGVPFLGPSWIHVRYENSLNWNIVQYDLKFAIKRLLSHHSALKFHWIIPTALGYTGLYKNVRDLREKVIDSRDWFSVYVAGFSYAIAISMTNSNNPLDMGIPSWFYFLFGQQMEQLWLLGMQASSARMFGPYVDCTWMLLKVLDSEHGQFSVDWLYKFHISVWYPWGAKEAQASISGRKLLALHLYHTNSRNSTLLWQRLLESKPLWVSSSQCPLASCAYVFPRQITWPKTLRNFFHRMCS